LLLTTDMHKVRFHFLEARVAYIPAVYHETDILAKHDMIITA